MAEYIVKETSYSLGTRQEIIGELVRCKDCRYFKDITSIHGECESADMWQSLFGEVTEVEAIEVHKDHYCGYAERRTDE